MNKPAAVFLAVTSGLVAVYLVIMGWYLTDSATKSADDLLAKGVWVAFGAVTIVFLCATFEAVSERLNQERHHADS